ncbi:BglG family transcription antiterminator [Sporolactobacillus putidus]|uniref:Transcriptional regulator n=1 Tax=Sporolactobacillus putidus TaxID=492735 RepID=A0A917W1C3_9BACL|nr:PRD domain-containing protein [Sporolactobacillus putidus]GGL57128.1 transcriptional regulator [Sporolactobacillus putidus]
MQLSKREQALTDILLQKNDYVIASEIANLADISSKTVYRTIKNINDLSSCGDIIESSRGRGFRINYENYIKERNNKNSDFLDYTPIERRNSVILNLLFRSPFPVSMENVYQKYFVSDSSIDNDLSVITKILKEYHIDLSRKGKSISITGTEIDIRKAINVTILKMNLFDADNLRDFTSDLHELNPYDEEFIISQLEKIERALDLTIPYPYNVNIFSHLYILITRFREGKVYESEQAPLDDKQRDLTRNNKQLYIVAEKVISNTSSYLNSKIPTIESLYLLQYLVSTRFDQDGVQSSEVPDLVKKVTKYYVTAINELEHLNINYDTVKNDLANHIKPMLNRINNHIYIKNNLLNEIKLEYGKLLKDIVTISNKAEKIFDIEKINEDESGFIVLYFAKYIEQGNTQQKVLIMCTSGVGTSELLKVKVKKYFRELDIIDVISTAKYQKDIDKYKNIDLILTTVDVRTPKGIPKLLVSAMFTNKDKERLKELLRDHRHGK